MAIPRSATLGATSANMSDRPSELEHVVLGIVWKFGPCTPHAIRTHFVTSRNSRFSASTGAIYPLVRRLEARGLLASTSSRRKRQRRRLYEISGAGLAALREWLAPPHDDDAFGVPHDPIRIRLYFLEALSPARRDAFFDSADAGFRAELASLEDDLARYEAERSTASAVATRGAIALCRARVRWIAEARRALGR